jgi:hypothetical protein
MTNKSYQQILSEMTSNLIIYDQLQFYADKEGSYTNKLFTFRVTSKYECFRILLKFAIANNHFRTAFLNTKVVRYGEKPFQTGEKLKSFCDYFNKCEYNSPPTLQEAINDYRMEYELQ